MKRGFEIVEITVAHGSATNDTIVTERKVRD